MDNQTINNVIMHLNGNKIHMPYAWVNQYGNNGEQVTGLSVIIEELRRLDLIDEDFDKKGHSQYLLKLNARNAIKNLPREFENKPYEYFLYEERKEADAVKLDKWYNRQDAKKRFDESPILETQRNWLFVFAVIEAIGIILALFLSSLSS